MENPNHHPTPLPLPSATSLSALRRARQRYHERIYARHAAVAHNTTALIEDVELTVYPGVFNPLLADSSRLLASVARNIQSGSVLDVGCGCGVQGIVAATQGVHATLSDISPAAVDCAGFNVNRLNLNDRINVVRSDAFQAIEGTFDWIICNPPFFAEAPRDQLDCAFCDLDHAFLGKVIANAAKFLARDGQLMLAYSSLGDTAFVEHALSSAGWSWHDETLILKDHLRFSVLRCRRTPNV